MAFIVTLCNISWCHPSPLLVPFFSAKQSSLRLPGHIYSTVLIWPTLVIDLFPHNRLPSNHIPSVCVCLYAHTFLCTHTCIYKLRSRFRIWGKTCSTCLSEASFTYDHAQFRLLSSKRHNFIPLYGRMKFHCVHVTVFSSIHWLMSI